VLESKFASIGSARDQVIDWWMTIFCSAGAAALGGIKGSDGKTSGFFGGGGMTLGSDEAPSVAVPDPSSRPSGSRSPPANRPRGLMASLGFGGPSEEEDEEEEEFDDDDVQIRNLTFWKDGFSIEDGPLMTYDDPYNKEILEAIKSGSVMGTERIVAVQIDS
jgi:UBX domain-containing protein 1